MPGEAGRRWCCPLSLVFLPQGRTRQSMHESTAADPKKARDPIRKALWQADRVLAAARCAELPRSRAVAQKEAR